MVREVRPQVLVTYDENGGYGHPDHIQSHRVAMAAVDAAADPAFAPETGDPWAVPKVYWNVVPRSAIQRGIDIMIEAGESNLFGVTSADELEFVVPDEVVTAVVDGERVAAPQDRRDAGARQPDRRRRAVLHADRQGRRGRVRAGVLPARTG